MTPLFRQLQRRQARGEPIRVAVIGAGFMGRGILYQLSKMPGMLPALMVNRTPAKAVEAWALCGKKLETVLVSDDVKALSTAVVEGRPAVSSGVGIAAKVSGIDVIIEATGAVELGAIEALAAFAGRKHFVSLNAETDGTIGCLLKKKADAAGVIYTNSDGDQPGVIMRLFEYVRGCGFEVISAVNCKGFMNTAATPESIMEWAIKQNTSPRMTAAFTDGTKLNIEQTVLCNATGLIPSKRGMIGVKTDLKNTIKDFEAAGALAVKGNVEYTLAGDFGGGIMIIARAEHPKMVQPYLKYLKMGEGPYYVFFRPYHLCHIETPLSAAEAVLFKEPTIAPLGRPVCHTVSIAKRDLPAGAVLDGIGGFNLYGEIDTAANSRGLLPVGLAEDVALTRAVKKGEPIPMDAVELDESRLLVKLWREQDG